MTLQFFEEKKKQKPKRLCEHVLLSVTACVWMVVINRVCLADSHPPTYFLGQSWSQPH